MSIIKNWLEEAKKELKLFKTPNVEFVIYKGFKITSNKSLSSGFLIEDVRYNNFYSKPSDIDLDFFKEFGFIKGADMIGFKRDSLRIGYYTKKIERLYTKRRKAKKEMHLNKKLNEKRVRNINKHIDNYIDLLFFYQTKINQFNNKYK